jgi:hypothetical protein
MGCGDALSGSDADCRPGVGFVTKSEPGKVCGLGAAEPGTGATSGIQYRSRANG